MAAQKQDKQEEKVNSKTKCLITATGIFFGIMAAVHAKDNDEDRRIFSTLPGSIYPLQGYRSQRLSLKCSGSTAMAS
jgi:hypothetical protein